jgi:hypothetical protein
VYQFYPLAAAFTFSPQPVKLKATSPAMHAEERLVKEFEIEIAYLPGHAFKVRADSEEQALKRLIAQFRGSIAELQKHKGQTK